jgi:hypothetical protein
VHSSRQSRQAAYKALFSQKKGHTMPKIAACNDNKLPSPNGGQTAGRDAHGRFAKGNPGGPGNPGAAAVGRLRARMLRAMRGEDIDLAITTMREVMAKGKDSDRLTAATKYLERALGAPVQLDILEKIDELERAIKDLQEQDQ